MEYFCRKISGYGWQVLQKFWKVYEKEMIICLNTKTMERLWRKSQWSESEVRKWNKLEVWDRIYIYSLKLRSFTKYIQSSLSHDKLHILFLLLCIINIGKEIKYVMYSLLIYFFFSFWLSGLIYIESHSHYNILH